MALATGGIGGFRPALKTAVCWSERLETIRLAEGAEQ